MGRVSGSGVKAWLAALATFALMALAPAAHAMLLVATPAVHTAAVGRARAHHLRHLRHRTSRAQFTRRRVDGRPAAPAPRTPAPERPQHRAALPRTTHERRHDGGHRGSQALPASAAFDPVMSESGRLEARQPGAWTSREGRVISGRGPPRPCAAASLPASSGRPLRSLRPAQDPFLFPLPIAPAATRGLGLPGASFVSSPTTFMEPVNGRSLARRPEGATACSTLPSDGEIR